MGERQSNATPPKKKVKNPLSFPQDIEHMKGKKKAQWRKPGKIAKVSKKEIQDVERSLVQRLQYFQHSIG